MSILSMWREARGAVMRKEYEDAMARMRGANQYALRGFHNNVNQTASYIVETYTSASPSDRKRLLKEARKQGDEMWRSGSWPEALGLAITCLNAESRFVPGDDAAFVRRETDRLIKEAEDAMLNSN